MPQFKYIFSLTSYIGFYRIPKRKRDNDGSEVRVVVSHGSCKADIRFTKNTAMHAEESHHKRARVSFTQCEADCSILDSVLGSGNLEENTVLQDHEAEDNHGDGPEMPFGLPLEDGTLEDVFGDQLPGPDDDEGVSSVSVANLCINIANEIYIRLDRVTIGCHIVRPTLRSYCMQKPSLILRGMSIHVRLALRTLGYTSALTALGDGYVAKPACLLHILISPYIGFW